MQEELNKFIGFSQGYKMNWILILCYVVAVQAESEQEYFERRNMFLKVEKQERTGGDLVLTAQEQAVNKLLMQLKHQEIDKSRQLDDGTTFPPAMHFFRAKDLIEKSEVFKFVRSMPKGAVLHLHDTSMVSSDWVVKNVTYRDGLYMCDSKKDGFLLKFAAKPPSSSSDCQWILVSKKRKQMDPKVLDKYLEQKMTILVDDPAKEHANQSLVWMRFIEAFTAANGAICYDKVFIDYYKRALLEFYEDNVQSLEIRTVFPEIYSLDGSKHDHLWFLSVLQNETKKFAKSRPDFIGAKIINSIVRSLPSKDVLSSIKETVSLKKTFPDLMIGYDLVGQEDLGRPLSDDIDSLLYPSQNNIDLKFFFHAGETDWEGEDVDTNIVDALLLNTSRIGHGYAIVKHPEAMRLARKNGVPIEVNPISNQVLGLVEDLRNHPAAPLLASGFPLVVSADDPGLWGAKGVSYDWYEMFMGPGGSMADLATLKKLAMDSIKYSGLSKAEKIRAMQVWKGKWDNFIKIQLKQLQSTYSYGKRFVDKNNMVQPGHTLL